MEAKTYRIKYKLGDTFTLKPLVDPHLGAKAADLPQFKRYLADSDKKTYFIGFGDLFDSIVWTDPRYTKSDDATGRDTNEILDDQVNMGAELLWPYRDKIIGLGLGNHEWQAVKRHGTNLIKRICYRLDIMYLGYSGLLKIIFSENGQRGRTMIIRYHHGWGGGSRTQGYSLTKYGKDALHWIADLYIYGHDHQCKIDRIPRMAMSGEKNVIARPLWICIGGTYLKSYVVGGDPTYSEIKGFPPVHIGGVEIKATPLDRGNVKLTAHIL